VTAVGPFIAYINSRTVGLPGIPQDIGNWGYWVGTVSLAMDGTLVVLSIGMLRPGGHAGGRGGGRLAAPGPASG
jgi:hypothetical protein